MKRADYIKGVITGLLIGAAVFAAPAIAENIDALFNQLRINVNGVDQIQWGEEIDLDNGETTPSSILYNGTTYLPMRKLGELSGQQIYWNGDSKTVAMTGAQKDINVVVEKPDRNGNVWTYYTFKDDENNYLGVKDEARGYERVYRIASNVYTNDDAVYFFKVTNPNAYRYEKLGALIKLSFDNDDNTQDGEEVYRTTMLEGGFRYAQIIDDEYVCITKNRAGNGSTTTIQLYNYKNGCGSSFYGGSAGNATSAYVDDIQNSENEIILKYGVGKDGYDKYYEVVYDKIEHKFGEHTEIKEEDN